MVVWFVGRERMHVLSAFDFCWQVFPTYGRQDQEFKKQSQQLQQQFTNLGFFWKET